MGYRKRRRRVRRECAKVGEGIVCVASPYRVFLVAATACACLSITGRQASLNLEASLIGFSLLNKSNTRKPYQRGLPSVSHHFQSFACAYGYG
jgi:hypothetical protein